MISLFDIAVNDQSISYLSTIFGAVGTILPVQSNPNMLLGVMFKFLNTTALVIGTLVVVYVTVIGVLATAHEGEFMGKKWSGIWIPIRMVLGIVGLFPTSTGYCAIQIIIMWIIVQGIGAADTLWTRVLTYVQVTGSPFVAGGAGTDIYKQMADQQMKPLFNALMCQSTYKLAYTDTASNYTYYCSSGNSTRDTSFCTRSTSDMLNVIDGSQVTNASQKNAVVSTTVPGTSCGVNGTAAKDANKNDITNGTTSITCYQDVLMNYQMGPGASGACGLLTYPNCVATCNTGGNYGGDPNNINCAACKGQIAAMQAIVPIAGAITASFAEADHDYARVRTVAKKPTDQTPNWLQTYCSTNGKMVISAKECCSTKDNSAGLGLCPNNDASCDCGGKSLFTYDVSSGTYSTDASTDVIDNVLAKYAIQPNVANVDVLNALLDQWVTNTVIGPQTAWITNHATDTPLTDWMKNAGDSGWILAGGYYYSIAAYNSSSSVPDITQLKFSASFNTPTNYRSNVSATTSAASELLTKLKSSGVTSSSNTPGGAEVSGLYDSVNAGMLRSIKDKLTNNKNDPLVSIASFGQTLLLTVQILFAILIVLVPLLTGLFTANFIVLGTGMPLTPWGEAIKAFFNVITPFIVLILTAMVSIGGLLGIYVPLIPYIVFTTSAIGWFIGVIEAMVAAPFVALGILSPSGQHEMLGKAEPAVMILFNIFLRPTLMIFGMMAAMLLAPVVIKLINAGFMGVVASIMGGGDKMAGNSMGLLEQILFLAAYTMIIISAVNKCFSLIHYLPEKVLTWIGGQAVSYGEQDMLGEAKRGIEGAGSATAGAGKESGSAARAGGEAVGGRKGQNKLEAGSEAAADVSTKPDKPAGSN